MARYRGTVVSTRSAEETFDYMADFANAAEWDPGTATTSMTVPANGETTAVSVFIASMITTACPDSM